MIRMISSLVLIHYKATPIANYSYFKRFEDYYFGYLPNLDFSKSTTLK